MILSRPARLVLRLRSGNGGYHKSFAPTFILVPRPIPTFELQILAGAVCGGIGKGNATFILTCIGDPGRILGAYGRGQGSDRKTSGLFASGDEDLLLPP